MDNHQHKFFIYQVKADFEPLTPFIEDSADGTIIDSNKDLYRRVEYAYSGCNCGMAKKVKVDQSSRDEN